MGYFIISLAVFIVSGMICHNLARRRDANPVFWGVMGVVFGPFAFPFVFLARPVNHIKEGAQQ